MGNKRVTVKDKWSYHVEGFFRAFLFTTGFWIFAIAVSHAARIFAGV